jgi:hypothetical protein
VKAIIHFTVGDYDDSIVVDGSSPEEIRTKADAELAKRGGTNPWSEIIEE